MCCTAWGLSELTAVCQQHARRIHAVEEALFCHSKSAAERGLVKLNQSFSIFPFVVVIHWEVEQTEVQLDRRLHLKETQTGWEVCLYVFSHKSKSGSFPASVPFRVFDSRHGSVSWLRCQEESCFHLQRVRKHWFLQMIPSSCYMIKPNVSSDKVPLRVEI